MTRALILLVLMTMIGCGGAKPTPVANPNGPRPIPGGNKPVGSKTEWDTTSNPKPRQ
ncbi:MAG: hypothetical protein U0840_12620 [Gemmataceae bacterium]